ncbi:hypothetical protein [Xanthobacter autotrophicus]|uniref:hypothetical protein n=1 Tax=Xanthobacter autotrophicus TaxID=280 RepID=UPI0024A72872|nr:hypothetical protein [Xanthobacter autotrophicus]MDI4659213.1 hypothetical protein [Xanthobacter autotrophicus]
MGIEIELDQGLEFRMARIQNPTLFSTYFSIKPEALAEAGLIDPFLDVDVPLFIDPVLLEKSSHEIIKTTALNRFRDHFRLMIRMLAISKTENDVAWKGARRQLNLQEPPENGLGYGGSGRSGSSRPDEIRETILRTTKEIITLGADDPEMISLMGFFEENVGPDTISDMTTTVILNDLAAITEYFCIRNSIKVFDFKFGEILKLPKFIDKKGRSVPIVLVPKDIVRDLPIARDWSDIERAAMENARIRERVNRYLGGIVEPTIADRKHALRRTALHSSDDFKYFLSSVKENVSFYDETIDSLAYYKLKDILSKGGINFNKSKNYNISSGPEEILRIVMDTIEQFKHHVENGNLWEELWIGDKPKKERASQLIYYAIADSFCKANDLDISPEANIGGGPIDFKFSVGYSARVLVEMKRSGGTVVHGYEKQLEFYKNASRSEYGVFVVMNFGDLGGKLIEINKIREERIFMGQRASDIVVIDASRKMSASKRH